jgi:hypothetical protein
MTAREYSSPADWNRDLVPCGRAVSKSKSIGETAVVVLRKAMTKEDCRWTPRSIRIYARP